MVVCINFVFLYAANHDRDQFFFYQKIALSNNGVNQVANQPVLVPNFDAYIKKEKQKNILYVTTTKHFQICTVSDIYFILFFCWDPNLTSLFILLLLSFLIHSAIIYYYKNVFLSALITINQYNIGKQL